jgi:transcriptional regulator with XRE-family HTH domain
MTTDKRFVMRLKKLRADREMTQEALAKKAGIARTYLARLELGQQDPTLGTLQKLAKALKVKVGELVE